VHQSCVRTELSTVNGPSPRFKCSSTPSHIDSAGGVDCGPAGGLADGEEAAYALDPTRCADVAPRAAVRYSTANWGNTPGGRPQKRRRCRPWRHEPPGSFRSRFKYSATLAIVEKQSDQPSLPLGATQGKLDWDSCPEVRGSLSNLSRCPALRRGGSLPRKRR
jgi:hypothetical protein